MKKIQTIFVRSKDNPRLVTDIQNPDLLSEWPDFWSRQDGIATKKFDGTACAVIGGRLYKRWDGPRGEGAAVPNGYIQAEPGSSHKVGWLLVRDGPEDKWHRSIPAPTEDGTYELCGPRINGNPEKLADHQFIRHGSVIYDDVPRDFAGLKAWLVAHVTEGIVWHGPAGRFAKIKRRDFGLPWPIKEELEEK
jgi:hypothetical protein